MTPEQQREDEAMRLALARSGIDTSNIVTDLPPHVLAEIQPQLDAIRLAKLDRQFMAAFNAPPDEAPKRRARKKDQSTKKSG